MASELGDSVITIYRLVLVTFIALVIFGLSSVFYSIYIDVRDAEAQIMARDIADCISPSGVIDVSVFSKEEKKNILDYCGISGSDRFYVGVDAKDDSGNSIVKLSQGDKGALWVKEFFDKANNKGLERYNPGYYFFSYSVFVKGVEKRAIVEMEVLVRGDED